MDKYKREESLYHVFPQKSHGTVRSSQTPFLQHSRSERGLCGRAWFHPGP